MFAAERFAVPQNELKPGGWQLEPPIKRLLLARLLHGRQSLGDYCQGRMYYGIKTGLGDAFVITGREKEALIAADRKSEEVIQPFVRGRDVKHWHASSVVRKTVHRPAPALLQKAHELLNQGYVEAAANYVRQAFETGIRTACQFKGIKLPYKLDATDHKAQALLDELKKWPGTTAVPKADWDAALHRLELLKNVVMNPYSHPNAPNIPKQEVMDAANAMSKFLELARK